MSQHLVLCIQKNGRANGGGGGASFCLKVCIYVCIKIRALGMGVSSMERAAFQRLAGLRWVTAAFQEPLLPLWHRKVFPIPLQKSAAVPLSAREQVEGLKSVS